MRDDLSTIGLSTVWNVERCRGLDAAVAEILGSGIGLIEISAPRGAIDVEAAAVRLAQARGRCAAVSHPLTGDVGIDLGASGDEGRRAERALESTIAAAATLRAPVVLVKGPRVSAPRAHDRLVELGGRIDAGAADDAARVLGRILEDRAAGRDEVLDRFCRRLHAALSRHAGLRIAIVPSSDPFVVPDERELEWVFDEVRSARLGYWHSTGVVGVRAAMGLAAAGDWTDRYAAHMMGTHLSDHVGLEAGYLPGLGAANWESIMGGLAPSLPKILKLSPVAEIGWIRRVIDRLADGRV